jgi:hypothetical protein
MSFEILQQVLSDSHLNQKENPVVIDCCNAKLRCVAKSSKVLLNYGNQVLCKGNSRISTVAINKDNFISKEKL